MKEEHRKLIKRLSVEIFILRVIVFALSTIITVNHVL